MSKPRKKKRRTPKRVLALPDLEQSKAALLKSLTSKSGQRSYDRAITDLVDWSCSGPRLAFNRSVVLRHRIYLEQKQYAPTTINLGLAAVRGRGLGRAAERERDGGISQRMKLLLDTHTFLWAIGEPSRLSAKAAGLLAEETNELALSAASLWEILVKRQAGKLRLPASAEYFEAHMAQLPATPAKNRQSIRPGRRPLSGPRPGSPAICGR